MSQSKVDRALHGPSWAEVIFGAVLSFLLGAVLAAICLVLQPLHVVRELPKEPARGAVYVLEGSKDPSRGRQWTTKRQALGQSGTVSVSEEELNLAVAAIVGAPEKPAATGSLVPGTPNFRVREGVMQVSLPATLNAFGFTRPVHVVAIGDFDKRGDAVVFDAHKFYVGSCAVERVPFLEGFIRSKIAAAYPVPEDLMAMWNRLEAASIEGNQLRLTLR